MVFKEIFTTKNKMGGVIYENQKNKKRLAQQR